MANNKVNIGLMGETAVALELIKLGYDVININSFISNYKNADLIVMNRETGKSTMIQVKCGTTKNIVVGFTSELDGTIPELDDKIICPWVFVKVDEKYDMDFYILSSDEAKTLIKAGNDWYVHDFNRQLKRKPLVGMEISWLEGKSTEASAAHLKIQHKAFNNPLGHNSKDNWEKITNILE